VVIFKVLRHRNQSESGKNMFLTIVYGSLLIFFVNMIMIINGFVTGEMVSAVTESMGENQIVLLIIIKALPFHGLVSLLGYLVGLVA